MDVLRLASLSLAELRARFLDRAAPVPEGFLELLEADCRRGAQELARRIAERRHDNRAEGQRLRHLLCFEREAWAQGFARVAGVDEAGVATLAGPVVAGACILPRDFRPRGIDDSKKLEPRQREALEAQIKERAVAWAVGQASPQEIDALNIYHASLLAMRRAVEGLSVPPDFLLVDARKVPGTQIPQRSIIHGDALSLTIAAGSILAKTARDRLMVALAARFPGYGFEEHKGYPTAEHFEALRRLGACPEHRRSFAPVRAALSGCAAPEPPEGDGGGERAV